ncbi:extracellular solute-binding protein [Nocardioidaceae bacterium SCSIO 66511]|nr:extracellular solute-binding protein [Nocardioidaceae bacterium SCSIO 66511]
MTQTRGRRRRAIAIAIGATLAASALSGCAQVFGVAGEDNTLTWWVNPDGVETQKALAEECSKGKPYDIDVQQLPTDATQQRVQLARRLAADDSTIDLMNIDPPFMSELANAGYLAEVPEDLADAATGSDVLQGVAETVTWDDKIYGIPQWANTQVLWYRKSLAQQAGLDMSKPVTWDQVIEAAADNGGTVGVQANKYEAYAIWINQLIEGAGGHIVSDVDKGVDLSIDIDSQAGRDAAAVIEKLADSKAAQPDLTNSNEGTSLGLMYAGAGEFMTNWTFVYANYAGLVGEGEGMISKQDFDDLGWARYPQTVQGTESKPPIGGIDIGVGAFSEHKDWAFEVAECLTSPDSQTALAVTDGLMPARASVYDNPDLKEAYPADLLALFRESIDTGAPRPKTPYWSTISGAIQNEWHPPTSVDPDTTPKESATYIRDVLDGKALL